MSARWSELEVGRRRRAGWVCRPFQSATAFMKASRKATVAGRAISKIVQHKERFDRARGRNAVTFWLCTEPKKGR